MYAQYRVTLSCNAQTKSFKKKKIKKKPEMTVKQNNNKK